MKLVKQLLKYRLNTDAKETHLIGGFIKNIGLK